MSFFQRMNFFKGLFTTADDWRAEQSYHMDKQRLHSRAFYSPGIVNGERDNLKVGATENGNIIVQPGYAIDAQGRDLYLGEPKEVVLNPDSNVEKDLYIFIGFAEEKVEPRENRLNPEYKDHAFIVERPTVDWTDEPPDNKERLELARVKWRPGQRVTAQQISTSNVKYAGSRQAGLAATRVCAGTAELNGSEYMQFSREDDRVRIETFENDTQAAEAFYISNVCPLNESDAADARIFWRIESCQGEQKKINYYLLMKNFGNKKVTVRYTVYRLNLGRPAGTTE